MATYFKTEFVEFFQNLENNNDRDWFNANKAKYESEVKAPFEAFIADLIDRMVELDKRITLTAKDAILRIYKDTRFSADKTPYKIHASAVISPTGRKDPNGQGIYLEFGGKHARVYGGAYMPEKELLQAIRHKIMTHSGEFQSLLENKDFVRYYGTLHGDKNKVLPKEFKEAAAQQPWLYNKAFYFFTEWPAKKITGAGFMDEVIERYLAARPMIQFLTEK